jgi:hypothetical protein
LRPFRWRSNVLDKEGYAAEGAAAQGLGIEAVDPIGIDLDHCMEFRIDRLDGLERGLGQLAGADFPAFREPR